MIQDPLKNQDGVLTSWEDQALKQEDPNSYFSLHLVTLYIFDYIIIFFLCCNNQINAY